MRFVVDIKSAEEDKLLFGEYGSELATLATLKINVPNGFIITTDAYFEFLRANKLQLKIKHLFGSHSEDSLDKVAKHFKRNILQANMPEDILVSLFTYYRSFGWKDKAVSLFPSLTDPDLKLKSKANSKGEAVFLQDVKEIWASFFDQELLSFRHHRSLNHFKTGIAIVVLENLSVQKSGFIEESKITLSKGSKVSEKEEKELLKIEEKILENNYFSKKAYFSISKGKIYITNTGPLHRQTHQASVLKETPVSAPVLDEEIESKAIGGIATGIAKIVESKKDIANIKYGDVVILPSLKDYDQLKALKHAKAVVVKSDIDNQHIKTVLSQMGFPVAITKPDDLFRNGMIVTVDGLKNRVYKGEFKV